MWEGLRAQDSSLGDRAGELASGRGSPAGLGYRCSARQGARHLPSPRPPRGGGVGQGPRERRRDPVEVKAPRREGGEVRMTSNGLSGVDFPRDGRMGSFWFLPLQEGKLRQGTVPSPIFTQLHPQLL